VDLYTALYQEECTFCGHCCGNLKSNRYEFIHDGWFAGVLQRSGGDGSEWQQDCLACLLKLLCQLGVSSEDGDILHDVPDNLRNKRAGQFHKGSSDKLVIPKLNEVHKEIFDSVEKYLETFLSYIFQKQK
jgi:hypothetical protein